MDKLNVYIAGWYDRREELLGLSRQLEQMGYNICSGWLTRRQDAFDMSYEAFNTYAMEDIADIDRADIFVIVSNEEGVLGGGGRHWELGYIWSQSFLRPVDIASVGRIEHVFYCLPEVHQYETWEDFLQWAQNRDEWV